MLLLPAVLNSQCIVSLQEEYKTIPGFRYTLYSSILVYCALPDAVAVLVFNTPPNAIYLKLQLNKLQISLPYERSQHYIGFSTKRLQNS